MDPEAAGPSSVDATDERSVNTRARVAERNGEGRAAARPVAQGSRPSLPSSPEVIAAARPVALEREGQRRGAVEGGRRGGAAGHAVQHYREGAAAVAGLRGEKAGEDTQRVSERWGAYTGNTGTYTCVIVGAESRTTTHLL